MKPGKLYLIPSAIAPHSQEKFQTPELATVLSSTRYFIVENVREARRFISSLKLDIKIEDLTFAQLDKHNKSANIEKLLAPVLKGNDIGLISDAGCPGVADPGSEIVALAHDLDIQVVPLVGPSSILLALMAGGLSGQNFRFSGYLPIEARELRQKIIELELHSKKYNETQIFIETPYRSDKMLRSLLKYLAPSTRLTVAVDLNGKKERIKSMSVKDWQKFSFEIGKTPTVFLYQG